MKSKLVTSLVAVCALAGMADVVFVDEFDLSGVSCGMGLTARAKTSICGNPIRLGEGR